MKNHEKPMHIITALLADESVSLGQITVESKSNEIPAVRELIELLNLKGAVLTMDAMHCQKETAELIIDNGGDYVLQLKGNQGNFYKDVYAMFDDKYMDETDKECEYEMFTTIEKAHGRIEKRTCYVLNEIEFFTNYLAEWKGLKKIFAVKREIEKDVKQDRLERLLDVAYPIFYEKNKSYLGTIQEVLIEGESKNNPEVMTGRTRTFKLVNVKCDKSYIGKLVNTKIVDFNTFALTGEMVD